MEPRFESHLLLQSPGCLHYPSLAWRREATIEAIGWHLFAARVWGGKAARRLQELVSCEVMSAWARVISRERSIHVIGPDREEPGAAQHLTWSWMQLFEGWGGGTAVGAGHSPQHRSPDAAAPGPELGDWPAAWGEGDKKDSGPAEKS